MQRRLLGTHTPTLPTDFEAFMSTAFAPLVKSGLCWGGGGAGHIQANIPRRNYDEEMELVSELGHEHGRHPRGRKQRAGTEGLWDQISWLLASTLAGGCEVVPSFSASVSPSGSTIDVKGIDPESEPLKKNHL